MQPQAFIRFKGTNGFLPGPLSSPGRENAYFLLEGLNQVRLEKRRLGGLSGSRRLRFHEPFAASCEVDKVQPMLMECLCLGGELPEVEISLWEADETVKERRLFLYRMENVRLTSIKVCMRDKRLGLMPLRMTLEMRYDKISWLHDAGHILFWDSLKDSGGGKQSVREEGPAESVPVPPPREKPAEVVLTNPRWESPEIRFNEETLLSVECDLPPAHRDRRRVDFELFVRTSKGPESIAKAEGSVKNGRAACRMPVYKPRYRENGKRIETVEYFFTAKHRLSDPLDSQEWPEGVKTVPGVEGRFRLDFLDGLGRPFPGLEVKASAGGGVLVEGCLETGRVELTKLPPGLMQVEACYRGRRYAQEMEWEMEEEGVLTFLLPWIKEEGDGNDPVGY